MTLPSKDALRAWLVANPNETGLRAVARAFGIRKPAERRELKAMLAEIAKTGGLPKRARRFRPRLPPVLVLRVTGADADGDLFAEPEGDAVPSARVLILPLEGDPALTAGDRILARISTARAHDYDFVAELIRRLPSTQPKSILGLFRKERTGGRIEPITRGVQTLWRVDAADTGSAQDGELVEATVIAEGTRLGAPRARVTARLGDPGSARSVSLIAIHEYGLRAEFPPEVLAEAEALLPPGPEGREDLRALPFVTIDPEDARDHDDAVAAFPDPDRPGVHIVWVAIADVSAHVRPGSALDQEARLRGNSTYFPDRVVPMLPERLSADLCSLRPGVGRPVIAVELRVDPAGRVAQHRFVRGWIESRAALTYEQVQAAFEGRLDATTERLAQPLEALRAAWQVTRAERARRQPLELDLPERKIVLDAEGRVVSVGFRERYDSHRLIEDFMIMANVAAAEALLERQVPLLFRIHEEPAPEKIDALREVAEGAGFSLPKGEVLHTRQLNRLLEAARDGIFHELIHMAVLRAMTQAYYGPERVGHFGLALPVYAHFTSPIRRYADLIVHRALISAHGWGDDGLSREDVARLEDTAKLISQAERRSMAAERDTADRYLARFLADRVGATFSGVITGVARFGIFVRLDESGAEGLVPVRSLGDEFFLFDPEAQTLSGEASRRVFGLGQKVVVKLVEAVQASGALTFELIAVEGTPFSRRRNRKNQARKGAALESVFAPRRAGKSVRAGRLRLRQKA